MSASCIRPASPSGLLWATERAAEATGRATEAVEQIGDVFKEVVRISNPIECVKLSVSFALPMDDPTLLPYKEQLDKALARSQKGPTNSWCSSSSFSIGRGELRSAWGQDTIRGDHPMFPGGAEDDISSAVGVDRSNYSSTNTRSSRNFSGRLHVGLFLQHSRFGE